MAAEEEFLDAICSDGMAAEESRMRYVRIECWQAMSSMKDMYEDVDEVSFAARATTPDFFRIPFEQG